MSSSAFSDLLKLIAKLRDPRDGCPWDRAQDHQSLRPYLLEEAHEAIAAIESGDPALLADELGDVLLQVILHSQIAAEQHDFTIDDVIAGLSEKLKRRHPHVFGDASKDLPTVHRRWREIKEDEGRPRTAQPTLVQAKRLLHALDTQEKADLLERVIATSSGEEKAGLGILVEILASMREGYDPEIALLKGIGRLEEAA